MELQRRHHKTVFISDDTSRHSFTVRMDNVQESGYYWCAIHIPSAFDKRARFFLNVTAGENIYIYIYAFSRRFYPKRLTVHSGYTFSFISMCVPWELNPRPFALLTQCSTTEPQEQHQMRTSYCYLNRSDVKLKLYKLTERSPETQIWSLCLCSVQYIVVYFSETVLSLDVLYRAHSGLIEILNDWMFHHNHSLSLVFKDG